MANKLSPHALNVAPFKEEHIHRLGYSTNWLELRRVIGPLTAPGFAVVDGYSQFLVDNARRRFDLCVGQDFRKRNALLEIAHCSADGVGATVELLLSVGVHPDMVDGEGWRPSHLCASKGHLRASRAVFLCRPDMHAVNADNETPLQAALRKAHKEDDHFPERVAGREDVANCIQNENLEDEPYTLAALAVRKAWFAIRNLVRRQVVPESEFEEKAYGKTAVEWADHFGEKLMAGELRYYASLPSAKLLDAEKKLEDLQEEVEKKDKIIESLKKSVSAKDTAAAVREAKAEAKWKDEVKSLQERCDAYEKQVEELTETVSVVTARLPAGGGSGEADEPEAKKAKLQTSDSVSVDGAQNHPKVD